MSTDFDAKNIWLPGKRLSKQPRVCSVCGEVLPKDRVVIYKGKIYGVSCGCSKDIVSMKREGK
jgi:formylmethanofuran dehydrogenase subunit E